MTLPFEIPLPADAPPTAAAVHSSMNWFVQARLMYAGFNGHMLERVRRPIVVVNAALTRHAREIADASATCSAVGRTPV